MKYIVIILCFLSISCASSRKTLRLSQDVMVVYDYRVSEEKVVQIAEQFIEGLKSDNNWKVKGKLKIGFIEEKNRKSCADQYPFMKLVGERFCYAQYIILYDADPNCHGDSMVLETCNENACGFELSEFAELCE